MTMQALRRPEEELLAQYLVAAVCDRASGRSEDECVRNLPHDVYFIGNLRPRDAEAHVEGEEPAYLNELRSKLSPVAFGAEFQAVLGDSPTRVDITLRWSCYYRVFPTLDQQRGHQSPHTLVATREGTSDSDRAGTPAVAQPVRPAGPVAPGGDVGSGAEGAEPEDGDQAEPSPEAELAAVDRRRGRVSRDTLFIRFRKVACEAVGQIHITRNTDGTATVATEIVQAAINTEIARAQHVASADPERVRGMVGGEEHITVPQDVLGSQRDFDAFLATLRREVLPVWRIEVGCAVRGGEVDRAGASVVRLEFINCSPLPPAGAGGRVSPNVEPFVFDGRAVIATYNDCLIPFELELAPRGFRYDRSLWGRGFNCSVTLVSDAPQTLETSNTPIFAQPRLATRTIPPAAFADLASNPDSTLLAIQGAMRDYLDVWEAASREYSRSRSHWRTEDQQEFDRDRARFVEEIERFAYGVTLIAGDPDIRLAFQLTNETFRQAGLHDDPAKQKTSWRLFQLVFLVSQLAGTRALVSEAEAERAERELVDIIYFPTGGGKTEAYLGVIVFHCFFDRLRGKSSGVTVWTRFPLRLLTLQQTQRVTDLIAVAEVVRRMHPDRRLSGERVDRFAVGYFVGKEGTPNELVNPAAYQYAKEEDRANWSTANDPTARQAWKRVTRCPCCKTASIRIDFDPEGVRLIHRCTNSECRLPSGEIPLHIVDNEIYRYLPSVIVGTIDKLAGLGNQRKLAQVFGQVDGRCSVHGYYQGKCAQKDCRDRSRLRAGPPPGLSAPTLFVQDELHLLKEGLGTFDSHYESFAGTLRRAFGQRESVKVIASSATIEAFDRQVQHLYSRLPGQARVFPGQGPRLGESFYAETLVDSQRLYVGILPHNKTIFNAVLELIELYHRALQTLLALGAGAPNPWYGIAIPGSQGWKDMLDKYVTSVTYFLAGRDLSSIRTDINGDVNPSLVESGGSPIELYELTGDTNSDDVTRILTLLEMPNAQAPSSVGVLATSMISHGVDIDRLNAMMFYGMPRQTAEYIQSSSRVGRAHPGIVFTCLHPARERDQSHYAYFVKYHEFLGQLVEPVAINRWATFSIQRTLPGLFMGVLLQVLASRTGGADVDRYYLLDHVKQRISTGVIQQQLFFQLLEDAYLSGGGDLIGLASFRAEIARRVPQLFDQIISAGPEYRFVSEVLIPAPMSSLRDVDEAVTIELDAAGTAWVAQ
jgi:hypothetical protein